MKIAALAPCLLAIAGAAACQASPARIDVGEARLANKLEMQIDGAGALVEIEYHVDPATLPTAVRAAMDALHPGGPFTDAERERHGDEMLYELSRSVDGLEVEAMFDASGLLHSEEVEVRAEDVPEAVRAAVAARFPGVPVRKYEEIRDGARQLREYHVKLDAGGQRHKVILSTSGAVKADFLEVVAEVEVPVPGS